MSAEQARADRPWIAFLAAALVLAVAFPDIVFLGKSLRSSRVAGFFAAPTPTAAWLPESAGRRPRDGYRDLAGAASQLEPAQRFIRRCLFEGESPYWNPYNGAGTHGPERLASASFSAMTVLTALLAALLDSVSGGFHLVLLGSLFVSVACLYRSLTTHLARSGTAALAGCVSFVLSGFHISMIGSQMTQPYVLAPILLLALLSLGAHGGRWRWVSASMASALVLAETFVPTTLFVVGSVHALSLAASHRRWRRPPAQALSDALREIAVQAGVTLLGLLLLAPLWFPIAESAAWVDLDHYEGQTLRPARSHAVLSIATPKHFWESYGAFDRTRSFSDGDLVVGRIDSTRVYHLGLIGLFLAGQALCASSTRRNPVVWSAAALAAVALGRTFGLPPFVWLERLPLLSTINLQYWGALLCLPFAVLLPFGFDSFGKRSIRSWWTHGLILGLSLTGGYVFYRMGWPMAGSSAARHVPIALAILASILIAFGVAAFRPQWRGWLAIALLFGMTAELVFYMNRLRPSRLQKDAGVEQLASMLESRLAGGRVLQVGSRGLPPNWGSGLAIAQIDSLDATGLRWWSDFFERRFGSSPPFSAIRFSRRNDDLEALQQLDWSALSMLGVRLVVVDRRLENYAELFSQSGFELAFETPLALVFENAGAMDRSWLAASVREAPGIPSDLGLRFDEATFTTDSSFLREADEKGIPRLLGELRSEGPVLADARSGPASDEPVGRVRVAASGHAWVELEAELERPGVLVLADTWHPAWRAEVNGVPTTVGRVNEVLRGLALQAGPQVVRFRYQPRSLRLAQIVALLVAAALLSWAMCGRRSHPGGASQR